MIAKKLSSGDFIYAEFSSDIYCPFCNVLLKEKPRSVHPSEDEDEHSNDTNGNLTCQHVGLWTLADHCPSVNENWRKEMFMLAREVKGQDYDGEDGYYWQEALELAIHDEGDGCIGHSAALAIPSFQVAVYKQFDYSNGAPPLRGLTYVAIILRKKKTNLGSLS